MRYYQEYKMNHSNTFSLSFPEAKTIIVSGDIHGDFNQLVFKLCIQYKLTDTLLIVAGIVVLALKRKNTMSKWLDEIPREWIKPTIGLYLYVAIMIIQLISNEQHSVTNVSLLFLIILSFKSVIIPSFV